jgi:hypothetical protein
MIIFAVFPKFHDVKMCLSNDDKKACVKTPVDIVLREWFHYCLTVQRVGTSTKMTIYVDGEKIAEGMPNNFAVKSALL